MKPSSAAAKKPRAEGDFLIRPASHDVGAIVAARYFSSGAR